MKKTTKQLAKELGFIRKRTSSPSVAGATEKRVRSHQLFAYLIVIDFESTCWNDGRPRNGQEITYSHLCLLRQSVALDEEERLQLGPEVRGPGVEFPAVLLNAANGQIENEFRTYLQPQEHPLLSAFCTELTGIQQHQVEAGVPLHICLSQFGHWLRKLQEEKNIVFARDLDSNACEGKKPCAFVTWSDWDLGVCLKGECQRKQIRRPDVLNSWIDLRVTYRMFYERKPKGLNGALQDLGICFTGREHSGLDDARNTAQLAWRMICDGCTMKITKSIDRAGYRSSVPPITKPAEERGSSKALDEIAGPSRGAMIYSEHSEINTKCVSIEASNGKENGPQVRTPTASNSTNGDPFLGHGSSSTTHNSVFQSIVSPRTLIAGNVSVGHLNETDRRSVYLAPDTSVVQRLLLHDSPNVVNTGRSPTTAEHVMVPTVMSSGGGVNMNLNDQHIGGQQMMTPPLVRSGGFASPVQGYSKQQKDDASNRQIFTTPMCGSRTLRVCDMSTPKCDVYTPQNGLFKKPGPPTGSALKQRNTNCMRTPSNPQAGNCKPAEGFVLCGEKKSSPDVVFRGSDSRNGTPTPVNLTSRTSMTVTPVTSTSRHSYVGKVTPPLCQCGRRSKRRTVSKPGPNEGRMFFSCRVSKALGCDGDCNGCGFFKWESAYLAQQFK